MVLGQTETAIKLIIDTECECNDSLRAPGKLGIYTYTSTPWSTGDYKYELIKELVIKTEQKLVLQQATYKIIYTPSDSSERKNQFYFAMSPYETQIHLNCFFFNKSYPSVLDLMDKKKDTVVFSSRFFGNTDGETILPTHTVVIFKKRKKYYASYYKTMQRELIMDFFYPKFETQIALSYEQLQLIRKFEENLLEMSINDNLNIEVNSKNHIWIHDKKISFDSKGYTALLLWNELNKTTANKK